MNTKFILALLVAVLAMFQLTSCADEAGYEDSKYVKVLTADNLESFLEENDNTLVEFYAPWCGHCKHLKPVYEKAAKAVSEKNIPVVFAALDASGGDKRLEKYGIRGFPTIKFFKKGANEPAEYEGDRSSEAFVSYAEKMTSPPTTPLTTEDEINSLVNDKKVVVVGYFSDKESAEYKAFYEAAGVLFDNTVVEVTGDAVKTLGAKDNSIEVRIEGEETTAFDGKFDASTIKEWVATSAVPALSELNQSVFMKRVRPSSLGSHVLFVKEGDEESNKAKEALQTVARKYKGKANFFYIDGVAYAGFSKNLGLSDKLPSYAVLVPAQNNHFLFPEDQEITAESVEKFVEDQIADKLTRKLKSAQPPADNSAPVTVVVGETFDQIVLDETKDVLVEFYAPWCGHCKKLAPIYEELGAAFQDVDSIVIAQIDMDANEIDGKYGVQGFPTLKFFPANNKSDPIDFKGGERSLENLKAFVEENASITIVRKPAATSEKDEL